MLNSLAESYIQRFCGRYLKNFSSENVSVGVTGSITLSNIQLRTEELLNFQLPYKPVNAFIGTLYADLPLGALGGNFDIRVSDVLVVCERSPDDPPCEPALIHKALQMWIGAFYFSLAQAEAVKAGISSTDIEYSQRLFDRLYISFERFHIRVEEIYTAHIPPPIGKELLCAGVTVGVLELRPPTYAELGEDAGEVWQTPSTSKVIVVNKLLQCSNLHIYITREVGIAGVPDVDLTIAFVKSKFTPRSAGCVLNSGSVSVKFSAAYQKATQVFGPIKASAVTQGLDFNLTDEQIAYIGAFGRTFERHLHRLQMQSRIAFNTSAAEASRRAQMRWAMIRESIKMDWFKFTSNLDEGCMRWRSWFEMWRYAARYVALREILLYHVGFEATPDPSGETVTYAISECLLADHHRCDRMPTPSSEETSKDALVAPGSPLPSQMAPGQLTKKQKRRYQGIGVFAPSVIKAAEQLLRRQIASGKFGSMSSTPTQPTSSSSTALETTDGYSNYVDPLSLSPSAIRALYALQLQIDTQLPIKVCAMCRLWAEERYRIRRAAIMPTPIPESIGTTGDDKQNGKEDGNNVGEAAAAGKEASGCSLSLLIAVMDAVNLRGTLGATRVDAYCTIKTDSWQGYTSTLMTQTLPGKISSVTGTTFISWGDLYALPVSTDHTSDENSCLKLECNSRGFLSPSYGKASIPRKKLLEDYIAAVKELPAQASKDDPIESPIISNHYALKISSAGLFGGNSSKDDEKNMSVGSATAEADVVSVRIMSMVVYGPPSAHAAANKKMTLRVQESLAERRQVLERQQRLAEVEANRGGVEEEEEEVFILDPSVLTVQDVNLSVRIPRLSFCLDMVYLTPPSLRASLGSQGKDINHSTVVPLLLLELRGLSAKATASNNPWIVKASASLNGLKIRELTTGTRGKTYLSLPRISCDLSLEQTSTMSRTIGGSLDASCFDWNGRVNMPPFSVTLHPRSFRSVESSRGTSNVMWKSNHILSHLWMPKMDWAMGTAFSSMGEGGGPPPQRSAEATMRLGGAYNAFPKHINVLSELLAAVRHAASEPSSSSSSSSSSSGGKNGTPSGGGDMDHAPLPSQTSIMTWVTEMRAMDLGVNIKASYEDLSKGPQGRPTAITKVDDPTESDFYSSDEDADDVVNSKTSKTELGGLMDGSALLGWMNISTVVNAAADVAGAVTSGVTGGGASGSKDHAKEEMQRERLRRKAKKAAWLAERAKMEAKIRQLEEKISELEGGK